MHIVLNWSSNHWSLKNLFVPFKSSLGLCSNKPASGEYSKCLDNPATTSEIVACRNRCTKTTTAIIEKVVSKTDRVDLHRYTEHTIERVGIFTDLHR
jgi:hypothetical protein